MHETLPTGAKAYKRIPVFSDKTVPRGLVDEHATKAGVWGVINILKGQLRYVVPSAGTEMILDAQTQGVIQPEQVHRIEPIGKVSFYVEFWR